LAGRFVDPDSFATKAAVMSVFVAFLILPLSLVSKIGSLRFASLLGVLSIVLLAMCIVIRSSQALALQSVTEVTHRIRWATDGWSILNALPIVLFAYTCHVNVFSIYTELQRPSIQRMNKVVHRSVFITACVYLSTGLFGYLHYYENTNADILKNLDVSDPLSAIATVAVGLTVVLSYPLNIYPARFTLEMMFFKHSKPSRIRFLLMTTIMVGLSLLVALYVPNLDAVFSILGSTTSAVVCFILPPAFYLRALPGNLCASGKLPSLALFLSGIVIAAVTTFTSVYSIVHGPQ